MSIIEGPGWAFALFTALLVAAAIQDGWRKTISNLLVLALLGSSIASAIAIGVDIALWQNVATLFVVLVIGTFAFSAGVLGGGDVKLLAATAFWFSPSNLLTLLPAIAIMGGLLVLVWIPVRLKLRGGKTLAALKEKSLPYGIAIAAGGVIAAAIARDLIGY